MPLLTSGEQKRLLGPVNETWKCPKCGQVPTRNYCKSCDEFFFVFKCPLEPGSRDDHSNHRTY